MDAMGVAFPVFLGGWLLWCGDLRTKRARNSFSQAMNEVFFCRLNRTWDAWKRTMNKSPLFFLKQINTPPWSLTARPWKVTCPIRKDRLPINHHFSGSKMLNFGRVWTNHTFFQNKNKYQQITIFSKEITNKSPCLSTLFLFFKT